MKQGQTMTKQFYTFSFSLLTAIALCNASAWAADPVNITCPGGTCDNQTIEDGSEITVNDTGVANGNTINDTGTITINSGGSALTTTVNTGGNMIVNEGGVAEVTTVEGGLVTVAEGGEASGTTINSGTMISEGKTSGTIVNSAGGQIGENTYQGFEVSGTGVAENTSINTDGTMLIKDGGTADGTIINGGTVEVRYDTPEDSEDDTSETLPDGSDTSTDTGTEGTDTDGTTEGDTTTDEDTGADGETGAEETEPLVSSANNTILNSGTLNIETGGVANNTEVLGGELNVNTGGSATLTTVDGGTVNINEGGSSTETTLKSGTVNVNNGGSASSTTLEGGTFNVNNGGTATLTTLTGGTFNVNDGGSASQTTLDGGIMNVTGGGLAQDSTINNTGEIIAQDASLVSNTTVNSGGTLTLEGSANADVVVVNQGGLIDASQTNATVRGLTVNDQGSYHLTTNNDVVNATLYGKHYDTLFNGGVGEGIIVGGNSQLDVLDKARLNNTVLQDNGTVNVQNGGTVSATTAYGSSDIMLESGGSATNSVLNENSSMIVDGTALDTIVNSDGHATDSGNVQGLEVNSGGMAFNSTVNTNGSMLVKSGGDAYDTVVNGGFLSAENGANLNNVEALGSSTLGFADGANLNGSVAISQNATLAGTYDYDNLFSDTNISSLVIVNGVNEKFSNTLEATSSGKNLTFADGNFNISSNGANGSTTVSGWSHIDIGGKQGTAHVALAGDLNMVDADSNIKINQGSVLDTSGVENINILGSVINAGDLNMVSAGNLAEEKDNTTTIAGNYVGQSNSTIALKVDTQNNIADKLVVNGDVSGNSSLNIHITSSAKPGEKILFLEAPNDDLATASNFSIWRVNSSPYLWETSHEGNNWYMDMSNINGKIGVYSETLAYMGLPHAALEQTRSVVYNVINKINLRNNNLVDNRVMHSPSYHYYSKGIENFYNNYNFWIMPIFHSISNEGSINYDADIMGGEAGIDIYNNNNNRIGIFASYRQGDYEFDGEAENFFARYGSDIDIDSYLGGVYYRYNWQNAWALATVYGGIQNADIKTKDDVTSDTDATEYGVSLAAGYVYNINYSFNIEPSVLINMTSIRYDDAKDIYEKSAEFDTLTSLEADLGVKFEQTWNLDRGFAKVYIRPSILFNSVSGSEVTITNLLDKTPEIDDGTFARLEIGGSADLSKFFSLYATARATAGSDYQDVAVTAGLNYVF